MNVSALSGLATSFGGLPGPSSVGGAAGADGVFGKLIDKFVGEANRQQVHAEQSMQDLSLGRTDQMHQVLLEVAKADLAFRLVLEIRNRLSDAYQEIAKMPM